MKYMRLYADPTGETHLEDVEVAFERVEFAPPAPPLDLSEHYPSTRHAFCRFPPGWYGDWHPTPRRQVFFLLSGGMEVEVSDGEVRTIGPGSVVLVEDRTGKGHITRIVGETEVISAVVQLPD